MTLLNHNKKKGKGNIPINKSLAKRIENGKVVQDLPLLQIAGILVPLFTVLSPTNCHLCGSFLKAHDSYTRYIISSYGIIECPTTYWYCPKEGCVFHANDVIVGVTGSANYSDEYLVKQKYVRYDGKCSLPNSRSVGEIYTSGLTGVTGRAPCPTTLWKYEQNEGVKSYGELVKLEVDFDGTIYIDGYWVKEGWRKFIEAQLGRELTTREWKRLRYKIIYAIATEDKVILDFQITNINPSYLELIPLFNRIKRRLSEEQIKRVVSDEDSAIIDGVKLVLPNATHAFCVFHQLMNVTKKYLDQFKRIENIPEKERIIYDLSQALILSETVIESTCILRRIQEVTSGMKLSEASKNVMKYIEKRYLSNRRLLENGFAPETNNVMEQLFSLIDDIIYQARSFKTESGLKNFFSNLFCLFNKRAFNTGPWRGFSPLERARLKAG